MKGCCTCETVNNSRILRIGKQEFVDVIDDPKEIIKRARRMIRKSPFFYSVLKFGVIIFLPAVNCELSKYSFGKWNLLP